MGVLWDLLASMITLKRLENSFEYLEVQNQHATAKIALQGAHLFHYQAKDKKPLLWLSEKAYFKKKKPFVVVYPSVFHGLVQIQKMLHYLNMDLQEIKFGN